MEKLVKCPDCKGYGGDMAADITDFVECPTCDGTGEVKEGTKGWMRNLLESKLEVENNG